MKNIFKGLKYAIMRHIFLLKNPLEVADYYRLKKGRDIGDNTYIYPDVELGCGGSDPITIGRDCVLTGCTILGHDATSNNYLKLNYSVTIPTIIGDRCFIGKGAIILMGVRIGDDCIVGAGAVVSKDQPSGSIVAGNPARVVGKTLDLHEKRRALMETNPEYFPDLNNAI